MRVGDKSRLGLILAAALCLRCGRLPVDFVHAPTERAYAVLARAPAVYAAGTAAPASAESEALRASFEAELEPQARARLRHDPALDLVAAANAESFSDTGRPASFALLQWLCWRSGSVALYHDRRGGWSGRRRAGERTWGSTAAEFMNASPGSALSYGVARIAAGKIVAETIVFGWSAFDVQPFSKTYAPGAPFSLVLRPKKPHREVHFMMDRGDTIEDQTLAKQPDGSYFVSTTTPTTPGRYFVEIAGPPPARATHLVVPIYVGVPEPTTPDDFIQNPPPGPVDLAGWPGWIASRYDGERARVGKPPVVLDARLTAMAADRSVVFAADRRPPPTDGGAFLALLAAASIPAAGFLETVSTLNGTDSLLLHLLWPSVRKQVTSSDRLALGASVAPRPRKENEPQSFTLVQDIALADAPRLGADEAPSSPRPAVSPDGGAPAP
jgi:hypothetical protein